MEVSYRLHTFYFSHSEYDADTEEDYNKLNSRHTYRNGYGGTYREYLGDTLRNGYASDTLRHGYVSDTLRHGYSSSDMYRGYHSDTDAYAGNEAGENDWHDEGDEDAQDYYKDDLIFLKRSLLEKNMRRESLESEESQESDKSHEVCYTLSCCVLHGWGLQCRTNTH